MRPLLDALSERLRAGGAAERPPVAALYDSGVAAAAQGRHDIAVAHFHDVLARDGARTDTWIALALSLCGLERHADARHAAERAVALRPLDANAHAALGFILSFTDETAAAAACCGRAVAINPACAPAHLYRATLLRRLADHAGSLAASTDYIKLRPGEAAGYLERGHAMADAGRPTEAAQDFRRALVRDPGSDDALLGLGRALVEAGDVDGAIAAVERGIVAARHAAKLHLFTGLLHQKRGRFQGALDAFRRAIAIAPDDPMAYYSTGLLFQSADADDLAIQFFEHALRLRPDFADAVIQMAEAHLQGGRPAVAVRLCEEAARHAPARLDVRWLAAWARMHACDWHGYEGVVEGLLQEAIAAGQTISPFRLVALGRPNVEILLWSRAWAEQRLPVSAWPPLSASAVAADKPGPAASRIRLGYMSADFREHATARLVIDLFRLHDRTRFEVFGYKICRDHGTTVERDLSAAVDRMVDLTGLEDGEAARRIHADGIDILVDLNGYAGNGRSAIMAHRPAAIQVNYLGYPGTMGSPHIDYLVADAVVAPAGHQPFYDECLVHLPHSYQPNDRGRPGPDAAATRDAHGLPADAMVFCCFNNTFKLTPLMFGLWMRLLAAVPGAVLWLLGDNDAAADNLRAAAAAHGIAPARLVFAPRVGYEAHLARLGLADLFLDTLPYNAHTTASEALWCGVPVLTCLGSHFAGRVAASLLTAAGLPELIVSDLAAYEREALALARDPARCRGLRETLVANRATMPAFDTPRYARHIEAAFGRMVAMRAAGQAPAPFAVRDDGSIMPD